MANETYATRCPHRISTTLPETVFAKLVQRSLEEGRSLSNLSAFLLERALHEQDQRR